MEAAIQSAHIHQRRSGKDVTKSLIQLYEALLAIESSLGAHVGLAATLLDGDDAARAMNVLNSAAGEQTPYQPWWATRAACLAALGRKDEARAAFQKAMALAPDEAIAAWLRTRMDAL